MPAIRVLLNKGNNEGSSKGSKGSKITNTVTTMDSAVAKRRILSPMGSKSPLYPKENSMEMPLRQKNEYSRGSGDREDV